MDKNTVVCRTQIFVLEDFPYGLKIDTDRVLIDYLLIWGKMDNETTH